MSFDRTFVFAIVEFFSFFLLRLEAIINFWRYLVKRFWWFLIEKFRKGIFGEEFFFPIIVSCETFTPYKQPKTCPYLWLAPWWSSSLSEYSPKSLWDRSTCSVEDSAQTPSRDLTSPFWLRPQLRGARILVGSGSGR